ncbi:outer membrane beta-barrel protein [Variovorax sp. E3]|uniref:outer membrane beta-barrel protein n=1 Tax=Variovorax sp. E3 TaxID=1914993 RepID=UPI0018DB6082|nr:outer membrane beta-barrel protein [Variovorax sp. E3]
MTKTQARTALATVAALLLGTASMGTYAAGPQQDTGFYAGGSVGRSSYSLSSSNSVPTPWGGQKSSKAGTAYKLYGGYRLTENFGVEVGYARLGRVSQWTYTGAGYSTLQSGSGQAFYAAATARMPLGDVFALNGRLGVSRGRISGGDNTWVSGDRRFSGSSTGLMAGFGAEYRVTQNLAITADYDYFGKLSKQAKGGMLSVGLKASF